MKGSREPFTVFLFVCFSFFFYLKLTISFSTFVLWQQLHTPWEHIELCQPYKAIVEYLKIARHDSRVILQSQGRVNLYYFPPDYQLPWQYPMHCSRFALTCEIVFDFFSISFVVILAWFWVRLMQSFLRMSLTPTHSALSYVMDNTEEWQGGKTRH